MPPLFTAQCPHPSFLHWSMPTKPRSVLSQFRRCTGRTSALCNSDRNEGCTPSTQTELSNMDIFGDPSGHSSALATAPYNVKKEFTTASSPTILVRIAVLLNLSCYYTLPIQPPLSLTSLKARVCPQRTSSVLDAAVGGGKGKARQPSLLFSQRTLPFPLSLPTAPPLVADR